MTPPIRWLAAAVLVSGCNEKDLVIESDTTWEGTVDRIGTVSGRGSARYTLDVKGQVCWVFTKTSTHGVLRVYAVDQTWLGLGSEVDSDDTTREPNGQVRGCAR